MNVESGWVFYSSDFSLVAYGTPGAVGSVILMRSPKEAARWHKMPDKIRDRHDGPPLFVVGQGKTFKDAFVSANLMASHAIPIPEVNVNA